MDGFELTYQAGIFIVIAVMLPIGLIAYLAKDQEKLAKNIAKSSFGYYLSIFLLCVMYSLPVLAVFMIFIHPKAVFVYVSNTGTKTEIMQIDGKSVTFSALKDTIIIKRGKSSFCTFQLDSLPTDTLRQGHHLIVLGNGYVKLENLRTSKDSDLTADGSYVRGYHNISDDYHVEVYSFNQSVPTQSDRANIVKLTKCFFQQNPAEVKKMSDEFNFNDFVKESE